MTDWFVNVQGNLKYDISIVGEILQMKKGTFDVSFS